ncbi:MAG: alanine/ornithine racemase family PLP-dependent enzyme [Bacteroidales bacterium]|nr:alanine/ornithine racemase family PLP-dependent enzyme [Bacteroidales bacterium]HPD94903.1 alanine/ornithine racemase family PLP-dependent enzyme [Tenuifilaceae bacterium]HRX30682.1 alanine/ornithine racemase family PLP-dependent enzyme [Tenuifilaceae bacterium]
MAYITLDTKKLEYNFNYLDKLFEQRGISWAVVSKMLCGNKLYLSELLKFNIKQICDSRISNLKTIKALNPNVETIFIKPPAKRTIPNVVKFADISMNTEFKTIQLLSEEAQRQNKIHKIIIMIELGELREGVMGEEIINFYEKVFELKNIEVIGIGTNLSCLYGVLPSHDKLIQLCLYKQIIEVKFNRKLQYISGGSSVTIPLIFKHLLPKGINHFRIGETLFLGTDVYNGKPFRQMYSDAFKLYAEIIELSEKPTLPMGEMGTNVEGLSFDFKNNRTNNRTSIRAIVDIGLLDVESSHITPTDKKISIVGASSDMIVLDVKENNKKYKVGDLIEFTMDYMGVLRVLNSKYIEKRIATG